MTNLLRKSNIFLQWMKLRTADSGFRTNGSGIKRCRHSTRLLAPATAPRPSPLAPWATPSGKTPFSHLFRKRIRMHFCVLIAPQAWQVPEAGLAAIAMPGIRFFFFLYFTLIYRRPSGRRWGGGEAHKSRSWRGVNGRRRRRRSVQSPLHGLAPSQKSRKKIPAATSFSSIISLLFYLHFFFLFFVFFMPQHFCLHLQYNITDGRAEP